MSNPEYHDAEKYADQDPPEESSSCWGRTGRCFNKFKFAVIFIVLCILALIVWVTVGSIVLGNKEPEYHPFTFNDVYTVGARSASLSWLPDGRSFTSVDSDRNIYITHLPSQTPELIYNNTIGEAAGIYPYSTFSLSPSQNLILFGSSLVKKWRHSYFAVYQVYNLKTGQVILLGSKDVKRTVYNQENPSDMFQRWGKGVDNVEESDRLFMKEEYYGEREEKREVRVSSFSSFSSFSSCFEEQEKRDVAEGGPLLLHPIWTTSTDTERVAYVQENNVYIETIDFTVPEDPIQVTNQGSDVILCGTQSWLYEEELFADFSALWWSTSGEKMAYFISDESKVSLIGIQEYDVEQTYPDTLNFPYPKVETENPTVSLYVYSLPLNVSFEVNLEPDFDEPYLTGVWWISDDILAVRATDRLQQTETLRFYPLGANSNPEPSTLVWKRTNDGKWIDTQYSLLFLPSLSEVCVVDIQPMETGGRYQNIVSYSVKNDGTVNANWVTSSDHDVTQINGYNEDLKTLYYTLAQHSNDRSIHSIPFSCPPSSSRQQQRQEEEQTMHGGEKYFSATFSPSSEYYLLANLGNGSSEIVPTYTLYSLNDDDVMRDGPAGNKVEVLQDNEQLKKQLDGLDMAERVFLDVPCDDETETQSGTLLLPPGHGDTDNKNAEYDMVLRVYGGPGSQTVSRRYALGYDAYLASTLKMVVASVDVRGTGFRGDEFKQQTYKQLGMLEAQDVLAAVKYFKEDKDLKIRKVCVWGWSYGGFLTAKTLQSDLEAIVDCGVSVAPVTDWRWYDSAYTERYMQVPSLNPDGYKNSSVVQSSLEVFERKSPSENDGNINISPNYMLVHGLGDDNVHYQHSAVFSRELVKNGVTFKGMSYTNDAHSINLPGSNRHVYSLITNFFVDFFGSSRYPKDY